MPADIWMKVVSGALAIGIMAQLAAVAHPVRPAQERTAASVALLAGGASPPRIDIAAIAAAHLFGAVESEAVATTSTHLPLILVATFAVSDAGKGMAIIRQDSAGPGRLYRIGGELANGAGLLREVRTASIVIDRAGTLETLAFPSPTNPLKLGAQMAALMGNSNVAAAAVAAAEAEPEPERLNNSDMGGAMIEDDPKPGS